MHNLSDIDDIVGQWTPAAVRREITSRHSALMHCAQRCAPVNSDEELFERMLPLEAWNLQSLISCRA